MTMSKIEQLQLLKAEVTKCTLCPELTSRTQTVFGIGNPNADIVLIGEAPGADENKLGEPFVGDSGKLLDGIITENMKLRRDDVFICNVLCCHPPKDRDPRSDESKNCRPFLDRTLDIIKPEFICCLGAIPAQNLLGTKDTLGSLRGKVHDYNGIKVVCTYHPAFLLRNPPIKDEMLQDIRLLMEEMKQ
jgi:DNA polymerase